jgi:U3 small nucleolar RNA-associated protein MPP10
LADIYADEFSAERARAAGEPGKIPEIDSKLQKEHDLLSTIFDEVCNKLDALSNAHFTPKQAQTTITTVSNLPSISLESALPTASSTATLLAPEEVYAPTQAQLVAKSEMTPSQKKAARVKARKARQTTQKSIQKYGGGSAKNQKERAMNSLIGKRGVTVVGKGKAAKSALTGKDRKSRGAAQEAPQHSGTALKL